MECRPFAPPLIFLDKKIIYCYDKIRIGVRSVEKLKRKYEFYSRYDHTGIEKHLGKMAAKGWMLKEIGTRL